MALAFRYEKSNSPLLGDIYRPIAQVFLWAKKKKKWYETWMIVDTGADYTLLPKYYARRLGINLTKDCETFRTSGIGGQEKVYLLKKLKVQLGSWTRSIPVGFLNRDNVPPLFGRHKFLETFDSLFSSKHTVTFSTK